MSAPSRVLFGAAVSFAFAAPLALPLVGLDDHLRVLILCVLAAVVAVGRAFTRSWSGALTNVALGTLIVLSMVRYDGAWSARFLGAALAFGLAGALHTWLGGRITALVTAAVLAVGATQVNWERVNPPVHTWNQFHYVLGTKYFDEVGYRDLYVATVLADQEGSRHFLGVKSLRDMNTYEMMSRETALQRAADEGLRERFTDARWAEFQHDLDAFYPMLGAKTWPGVLTDLGYNPSPVWVVMQRPLLQAVEISRRSLQMFAALQLPMYAAVIAGSWWAFGLRATLWLGLWNLLFFGSRGRIYGGYWSYDWFALVILAAVLVAKARPALAAVPVALGGLMRGFGGLLAIGPTVQWIVHLARERRPDPWTTRFLATLALAMGLLGAASLTTTRGAGAWSGWIDKIELHSMRISTGGRHLGLKVLFGEDWSIPGHTADLELRRTIYAEQAWAYHLAQALLFGWTLLVLPRRTRLDAALLGLIPAFATMVLSRYYYAAWSVLFLLGTTEKDREGRTAVQLGMLSILALHEGLFLVDGTTPDSRHQHVNMLLLVLAVITLSTYTVQDLRAWRERRTSASLSEPGSASALAAP